MNISRLNHLVTHACFFSIYCIYRCLEWQIDHATTNPHRPRLYKRRGRANPTRIYRIRGRGAEAKLARGAIRVISQFATGRRTRLSREFLQRRSFVPSRVIGIYSGHPLWLSGSDLTLGSFHFTAASPLMHSYIKYSVPPTESC